MLLIRHASAGKRSEWEGDDRRRPLDERGRRQATRLVSLLADYPIERLLSSPYDRCVQRPPLGQPPPSGERAVADVLDFGRVRRRELLGGLIHEYQRAA